MANEMEKNQTGNEDVEMYCFNNFPNLIGRPKLLGPTYQIATNNCFIVFLSETNCVNVLSTNTAIIDPETVTSSRKRNRNSAAWVKNKRRKLRQSGKEYLSASGETVPPRRCSPKHSNNCQRKCDEIFSPNICQQIFNGYWELGDIEKQRFYAANLVEEVKKIRKRTGQPCSRRHFSRTFFLPKENEKIQVCQRFFLSVFGITEMFIRTLLKKKREGNATSFQEKRGRHEPGSKRPIEQKEQVMEHIKSFPTVPSHYCRKSSNKEYSPSNLSLKIMYELYKERCENENLEPEKYWFYRKVFKNEFNLSFHVPRKDQCDFCYKYNQTYSSEEKLNHMESYNDHLKRKDAARNVKATIKEKALSGELQFYQFDLEAVRYCPTLRAKAIFYKRRLAVYNLTVYDVQSKRAMNYMWHEGVAKRGSLEIASCLFKKLHGAADGRPIALFSDSCGGQNRNINMCAMLLYAVQKLNIPILDQFFFEPGHSIMECDSVHARIEAASKQIDIYDPSGWYAVVRTASKMRKYEVTEMEQKDFLNFAELQKQFIKNRTLDCDGERIKWLKIVHLQYRKNENSKIFFKYDHNTELKYFDIAIKQTRSGLLKHQLNPAYTAPLKITEAKAKDLLNLCESGLIAEHYRGFYRNLIESEQEYRADTDSTMV